MKKDSITNKWWYRLLKALYYLTYIVSLILGIIIFPIVIIVFELLRNIFLYIVGGEFNFRFSSKIWIGIISFPKKIKKFIQKHKSNVLIKIVLYILLLVIFLGILLGVGYGIMEYSKHLENQEVEKEYSIELGKLNKCLKKEVPYFDTDDEYVSNNLTTFYDTNSLNCYLLREYNSHGGNGLMKTYLYNLENGETIGTVNNQIREDVYFATTNNIYINRLDSLTRLIKISKLKETNFIGSEFTKNDILEGWNNNYDKVYKLRYSNNYSKLKKYIKAVEKQAIEEYFISSHYRNLSSSIGLNYNEDELKDVYQNYLNPKVNFEEFKKWYSDVSSLSIKNLKKLEDGNYKFIVQMFGDYYSKTEYELKMKLDVSDNNVIKIDSYESKVVE